jgi:hypothetical protein
MNDLLQNFQMKARAADQPFGSQSFLMLTPSV